MKLQTTYGLMAGLLLVAGPLGCGKTPEPDLARSEPTLDESSALSVVV